ncbi:uncharacterized protein LOC106088867 [Stomoxys calcitrans]|uniref:MD-2-related lipid-recognition domain-containing protein n=1 Tax=Stomoxys calcitrans TaxID=35570 RepID=A0A1I8PEF3_STOCA|nr:uncharacterized protein LOC106088867 [Stomoxys calcitrans]
MCLFRELLLFLCAIHLVCQIASAAKGFDLTEIYCSSYNEMFLQFAMCKVDTPKNSMAMLNVVARLLETAVSIKCRITIFRKANKIYRPFIYDDTLDLCEFVKGMGHKRFVIWALAYPLVLKYTNANHTCPYEPQDVVARNFTLNSEISNLMPLPKGKYRVKIVFKVNNAKRGQLLVDCEKS